MYLPFSHVCLNGWHHNYDLPRYCEFGTILVSRRVEISGLHCIFNSAKNMDTFDSESFLKVLIFFCMDLLPGVWGNVDRMKFNFVDKENDCMQQLYTTSNLGSAHFTVNKARVNLPFWMLTLSLICWLSVLIQHHCRKIGFTNIPAWREMFD